MKFQRPRKRRIHPLLFFWRVALSLTVVAPTWRSACAYEGDHYALTYYVALQVGFTQRQAYQIASGAYALDWDANTSPMEASVGDAIVGARTGLGNRKLPNQRGLSEAIVAATLGLGNATVGVERWKFAGHPGVLPTQNRRLANTWKDFHAFADDQVVPLPSLSEFLAVRKPLGLSTGLNVFIGCSLTTVEEARAQSMFIQSDYDPAGLKECAASVKETVEAQRRKRKQELWELAEADRNPGLLLHYIQDYQSHFLFNNTRGHAIAGHASDFLSFNPERANLATQETLRTLVKFRDWTGTFVEKPQGGYLAQKPLTPEPSRIAQFLAELIEVNPKPDLHDLKLFDPSGPTRTVPSLGKSLAVVNDSMFRNQDIHWPTKLDEADTTVPPKWFEYKYGPQGRFNDSDAAGVERVGLRFDAATIKFEKVDGSDEVRVFVRLPYEISGLAPLGNYLYPLPVLEEHRFTGKPLKPFQIAYSLGDDITSYARYGRSPAQPEPSAGTVNEAVVTGEHEHADSQTENVEPLIARLRRENGAHYMEIQVFLNEEDFKAGRLAWEPSVRLYGYEAKVGQRLTLLPRETADRPPEEIVDDPREAVRKAIRRLGFEPQEERGRFANGCVTPLFGAGTLGELTPGGAQLSLLAWVLNNAETARSQLDCWVGVDHAPDRYGENTAIRQPINLIKEEKALLSFHDRGGSATGYFVCGTVLAKVSERRAVSTPLGEEYQSQREAEYAKLSPQVQKATIGLMSRFAEALLSEGACQGSQMPAEAMEAMGTQSE